MVLENEHYQVTITTEYRASLEGCPVLYQTEDLNFDDFYTVRFVTVKPVDGQEYRVAVLDFLAASVEPCAVLEGDMLTMILFHTILQIDLSAKTVEQAVDRENMGGLEEIHPIDDGYLIKGECDIFRYDKSLNCIWHRCGRDMFATAKGDDCFWIDGDVIHCRDWQGWHYLLNMNGEIIGETQEYPSGN